jgi:hypothetical protein
MFETLMTAPPPSLIKRFGWLIFYPGFVALVTAPAVRVLGLEAAMRLSAAALAWFAFTRLLLIAIAGAVVYKTRASSYYLVLVLCGAVIDSGGVLAALWLDHRLIWSAVAAILLTEPWFWWSPGMSKAMRPTTV